LVVIDHDQVITSCLDHLRAQVALTVQRISRQDPPFPIHLGQQLWHDGQLCLVQSMVNINLGQHNAKLMTEGTDGMDGVSAERFMTKTSALRLAITGGTLGSTGTTFTGQRGQGQAWREEDSVCLDDGEGREAEQRHGEEREQEEKWERMALHGREETR
jgi:hypothetical protein